MTDDTDPITKQVPVPFDVPRDPEAYRATIHFGQRLRERVPEFKRDRVVRETIHHGDQHGATPPQSVGEHDRVVQHFRIVHDSWTVVVGICPDAFRREDRKHLAMTIYEEDSDA